MISSHERLTLREFSRPAPLARQLPAQAYLGLAVAELQTEPTVMRNIPLRVCTFVIAVSMIASAQAVDTLVLPSGVTSVLKQCCLDCHSADLAEGDVRLDALADLDLDARLDLLNRAQEQLFLGRMPPDDEEQPTAAERTRLADWVSQELDKYDASKLDKKLQKPEFGNYVDHDKLFSGEFKDLPGFTYDRRWLISEYIFNAKFQRMLQGSTRARRNGITVAVVGGHKSRDLSLTNPFLLPERSGVRYYADTDLTGGHLSSMLTNAQKTSQYMTDYLGKRNSKYLPAVNEIMALEDGHHATLTARREFLEKFIAKLCEDYFGSEHETMLPQFVPVELNPVKELAEGETYKKLPRSVAGNILSELGGTETFYQLAGSSEYEKKSDEEIQELCERIWFYNGDHERVLQGRLAILREYMADFREHIDDKTRSRYAAPVFKPLADDEMEVIQAAILKHRQAGDFYDDVIEKCMAQWESEFKHARIAAGPPSDELLLQLVDQLFGQILERTPDAAEAEEYVALTRGYVHKLGNLKAIQKLIQTLILSSEFVYRQEFGTGQADEHGRRMLSPRDASYAIAYALTDQSPDEELVAAAASGKLNTREDYRREVTRILKKRDVYYLIDPILADKNYQDNATDTAIRKLRFFREFFGYPTAITIFKDEKRFGGDRFGNAMSRLLSETDRIVEYILEKDENVFEELLTTEEFFVYHDGDNERMQAASDRIKRIYDHFKDSDWQNFGYEELGEHREFLREVKMRSINPDNLQSGNRQGSGLQLFKKSMTSITARLDRGQKHAAPFDMYRGYGSDFMPGENVAKFFNYRKDNWEWSPIQPAKVPHRKGLLTHPAWLIAHAQNTETDPVIRGKWVREKLLAGTIPDVPITVDAAVPEDHDKTLRDRLASVTESSYCWKCHQHMNPLGYAFESYDDFGRYRAEESLEYPEHIIEKKPDEAPGRNHLLDLRDIYKTLPVDTTGYLKGTGDAALDGEVQDAMDLAERLAKSELVRQSIIRHAFRYFLGRNETLSDSKTLIDAERAYLDNNGSFDAVIVSLLTSDSFIYRKPIKD